MFDIKGIMDRIKSTLMISLSQSLGAFSILIDDAKNRADPPKAQNLLTAR